MSVNQRLLRTTVLFWCHLSVKWAFLRTTYRYSGDLSVNQRFLRTKEGGKGLEEFLFADSSDEFLEIEWLEVGDVLEVCGTEGGHCGLEHC